MSPFLSSLFLRQYLHCSGIVHARDPLMSVPFHRCVARGGGRRRGPRKSIYLFIYVPRREYGPMRGCETRLIAGACIEPGIPRERPHGMRGWQKSRGTCAGILDSAVSGARFSLKIYRVFIYLCIFPVKEYKMRLLYHQNLNDMNLKDMKITFPILFDRIKSVILFRIPFHILFLYKNG